MPGVLRSGEIDYEVKPLDQHEVFQSKTFQDNWACWYTAALMVLSYRGVLPTVSMSNLRSLVRLWQNRGIGIGDLGNLAQEAGLEHSPTKVLFAKKGAGDWFNNLSRLGPLIVIVPGHAVVVRGLVNEGGGWSVIVNDPWDGSVTKRPLLRFNGDVWWHCPILYRRSADRPPSMLLQPVMDPYGVSY